jgi:clan AA aspartic protease (TIGR02281 family)
MNLVSNFRNTITLNSRPKRQPTTRVSAVAALLLAQIIYFSGSFVATASTRSQPVEVPFTFLEDEIIVEAKINGKPLRMLLDTGADVCIINRAVATRIGLKFSPKPVRLRGIGMGMAQAYTSKIQQLEIGAISGKDLFALVTETTPKIGDRAVDGIIGFEFLKDKIFQVDYAGAMLRFYSAAPYRKTDAQSGRRAVLTFRLREKRDMPVIDAVMVNGKTVVIGIDTGSDSGLVLFPDALKMLGISSDTKALKTRVSFGYGGIALTKIGRIEDFSIGGLNLQGMEAEFAMSSWGGKEGGQMGNKVLKNFVVTFDYQNHLVTFEN